MTANDGCFFYPVQEIFRCLFGPERTQSPKSSGDRKGFEIGRISKRMLTQGVLAYIAYFKASYQEVAMPPMTKISVKIIRLDVRGSIS